MGFMIQKVLPSLLGLNEPNLRKPNQAFPSMVNPVCHTNDKFKDFDPSCCNARHMMKRGMVYVLTGILNAIR